MTRARILADYVSSGDELALKAPIAGPTFTGTVAIPNVANLETAVVANTAKVTNANPTLADINALDITELGTVTSGNLANTAIVYPAGHVLQIEQSATVTTSITTTATSTAAGDTNVLNATITTRQLNSKLLCQGVMLSHLNPNNGNIGVAGELWRVYDAGTDTSIRAISISDIYEYSATYYHESYRTSWMYMYSPNVVAGTAVKLGIKIKADDENTAGVAGYWHYSLGSTDAFFTITEVAV